MTDKTFEIGSGDSVKFINFPFAESFGVKEARLLVKSVKTPKLVSKEDKPKLSALKIALSKKTGVKFIVSSLTETEYTPDMILVGKRPRDDSEGELNLTLA